MAIAIVKDFDAKLFELNGIKYVRNFVAIQVGDNIRITNAYDTRFTLIVAHYSEFVINNNTFINSASVVSALSPILFVKDELLMTGGGESGNANVTAVFNNINGTYINGPNTPGTGNIILDVTNAVNGGACAVYYDGPAISKDTFLNGIIVLLSGANIVNELCLVFIMFDKQSNSFTVNIQAGATGDLPATDAPAQMTITNILDTSGDVTAPNTMEITNVINGDTVRPATMEITEIQ